MNKKNKPPRFEVQRRGRTFVIYDRNQNIVVDARLNEYQRTHEDAAQRVADKWNEYNGPPVDGLASLLGMR